ncbi:SprT-like domain-containing protein [Owenweeksia hongkongensis]|uniref:SprT-like domain-containing protein n=1 Tax=Owenweeksia hongkongensis (strain DSM 17368 / CIP 108786 / JCM 12287 / NRRL B-23963 / UST20020801) TaxID=926562 RepID=G8R180_OWEHD|nr:SprT-like domain-containing protein [Owenweeksia hongkongensis]AEV32795.1 hypothetical protein Oweho_1815 [Owenweeksia hongkongensis DSM 17368]
MTKATTTLEKYLPEGSLELCMTLLKSEPVQLKISRPRKTKFGDYRFPGKDGRHKISVNANLNPFAFLITLIHEMAHLKAFKDYGKVIKPHGSEWQQCFRDLAKPFLDADIFPNDVKHQFINSLNKGAASSCTDLNLFRQLKVYDNTPEHITTVEQVPMGAHFRIGQDKIFRKGPKSRKRYKCLNLVNKREYMVHPLAEVELVENLKNIKSA